MSNLDRLSEIIQQANVSSECEEEIAALLKKMRKNERVLTFKNDRLLKDNAIMTNFLTTTIQELEVQKKLVEEHSDRLKGNLNELREAYKEVEQFSYIASHDLKSPLRTVGSFVQLLQRELNGDMSDTAVEYCDFISKGVNQMNSLISDLLKYSRVGNKTMEIEPVDFNQIIDIVRFNLKEAIDLSNAQILVKGELPVLKVRKFSIVQLFQNLLGNAIKFRSERDPRIEISCRELEDKSWEFRVQDNGVGMDTSMQTKAFLPFQRLNNQDRPGSGIGLAICKKAVKIHDGTIEFESVLGQGTTFIFTLSETISLLTSEPKLQMQMAG